MRKLPKKICAKIQPHTLWNPPMFGGPRDICTKARGHKGECGHWESVSQPDHAEALATGKLPEHETGLAIMEAVHKHAQHVGKQHEVAQIKDEVFALVLDGQIIRVKRRGKKMYHTLGTARGAKTYLKQPIRDKVKIVKFKAVEVMD